MTWEELRDWYRTAHEVWTAEQVEAAGKVIAYAKSIGRGPPACAPADVDPKTLDLRWYKDGYVSAEIKPDGSVDWWTWTASKRTFSARGFEP